MSVNKSKLITNLEEQVSTSLSFHEDPDEASFPEQIGIVISANEARLFLKLLKKENDE